MRASLRHETEFQYRNAQERFTKVLANRRVKVEEMDLSGDFSPAGRIVTREGSDRTSSLSQCCAESVWLPHRSWMLPFRPSGSRD